MGIKRLMVPVVPALFHSRNIHCSAKKKTQKPALALKPSYVNGGTKKLLPSCDTVNLLIPSDPYLLVPVLKIFPHNNKKKTPACHRRKDTSSEALVRALGWASCKVWHGDVTKSLWPKLNYWISSCGRFRVIVSGCFRWLQPTFTFYLGPSDSADLTLAPKDM